MEGSLRTDSAHPKTSSERQSIASVGDSTIGAFALTRAILSLIVLGGFLLRSQVTASADAAITQLGFMLIAGIGLASSSHVLIKRWRKRPLGTSRPWNNILIDCALAIGVMASIDAETSPLAWIALIVPVVETAVLFSMVPAAIVWIGLSIAFLALRLTAGESVGANTLAIAIQQVLAVFLVSGPAALLSDSASHRISQLSDARREADHMADRLRRIANAANEMSKENTIESVLASASRSAITIGFDHADVIVKNGDMWESHNSNTTGPFSLPSPDVLSEVGVGAVTGMVHDDLDHRQLLHTHRVASGYAIRIDDGENDSSQAILRVWSEREPATEAEIRSLELLAGHAREIHRTAELLAKARAHSERLLHEVRHDSLTGIANRAFVISSLEQRISAGATMALFFIDLDGFKQINDTLGHRAGDVALVTVADRLSKRIDTGSLAGRVGGDEFIVIAPVTAFDTTETLTEFGNQLADVICDPMIIEGSRAQLGASIGMAIHTRNLDADQLISLADNAMYDAKRAGGGLRMAQTDDATTSERDAS